MLSQARVNLMVATMPISLTGIIDQLPILNYCPDARSPLDAIIDGYPRYVEPLNVSVVGAEVIDKPKHYGHFLHPKILKYLETEVRVTDAALVGLRFNTSQSNASDRLYELVVMGELRKVNYRHEGADTLVTLANRALTIEDIPNGARNDQVVALHAQGASYGAIGSTYNLSDYSIRRICNVWPAQRAALLAIPTH